MYRMKSVQMMRLDRISVFALYVKRWAQFSVRPVTLLNIVTLSVRKKISTRIRNFVNHCKQGGKNSPDLDKLKLPELLQLSAQL
jgi:hypothetical protein